MLVSKNVVILVFTVILTYFNSSCLGYHLLPYSNTTLIRDRRQADCRNAFSCKTGSGCVFYTNVCDGIRDCSDGSDETSAQCKDVDCPDVAFRCSYGACVDGDYRCNGLQECADKSDEDPAICGGGVTTPGPTTPGPTTPGPTTPMPPLTDGFCPAINIPNGKYEVFGVGYTQGSPIPNFSLIKLSCNAHFLLYPANTFVNCVDGTWNIPLPQCKPTCSPRISTSVDVTCTVDGRTVKCGEPLVEGTIAISKCKHFYRQANNEIPFSTCSGGSWDNPLIRCIPECGELIPEGSVNVVNGISAKKGEFPWHIGLYRFLANKHEYQCGGSIITPLIILTAAHCFTNEFGAEKYPAQEYYVAAGKYYSDYDSEHDAKLAQKNHVKEYHIPPQYRGYESNFAGDLAVVIVETVFQLSNVVQPVCVEWNNNEIERQQLKANNRGRVVGWGLVDPNKPKASVELKQLNAPYIDIGSCLDVVPTQFRRWVTTDKFCAGFTNGSSVCKGDSGGGMVFEWQENNRERYYIRGLVSVGPVTKGICDNFQYGVYTRISAYYDFILPIVSANPVRN